MNPQTRILDIETMALGIVEACKSLKIPRHPVNPCEENGCTEWQGCDEICIYHPDFQKAAQAIHDTKINCTPFPKTCPLPEGNDCVIQKDAYGNKTIGDVLKCH